MLNMIINEDREHVIHVSSINRSLDTANLDVHFVINGTFTDGYDPNDIDELAVYEDAQITKVTVYDENNVLKMSVSGQGHLVSLYETIDSNGASGYFSINM